MRIVLLIAAVVGVAACSRRDVPEAGAQAPATTATAASPAPALAARVAKPDSVRALYANGWAAGSRTRMAEIIRIADATEVNALIVDIKESDTYLTYTGTRIPLAREIGADKRPATTWLPELVDTLRAHGIYPIARIVVFKDRMLAERQPDLAIKHVNGGLWRDNKGGAWVNPYDRRVWDYNIAIAREAFAMGFSELQWDYVRFPDVTDRARATMAFPRSNGVSRADNIRDFLRYSKEQLKDLGVQVTADVFGLVTHLEDDVGIGQNWEKVIAASDAVLPMVYPSHYYAGLYGFPRPGLKPYEVVRLAVADAVERSRFLADSAKVAVGEVRPWLEAMSIRGLRYGPAELRAQIQGAYDAGATGWALWNPGSRFGEFVDAFRPATGGPSPVEQRGWRPPAWDLPRDRLSRVTQRRDRRALAAADSAGSQGTPRQP